MYVPYLNFNLYTIRYVRLIGDLKLIKSISFSYAVTFNIVIYDVLLFSFYEIVQFLQLLTYSGAYNF